jgi:hypothetical protein
MVEDRERIVRWRHWGPYLAERAWGTVREDYSATGDAWNHFPHDHARSRAYRWSEDGMAGFCDREQRLCLALALWNGQDAILKERAFGLSGPEGNHGEDLKDLYFYEDATPTASYLRYVYKYPQRRFPYAELVQANAARGTGDREMELEDLGAFADNRYFDVTVEYAKRGPNDVLMVITVENRGPEASTVHVLPHLWFRNTWSWRAGEPETPEIQRYSGDQAEDGGPDAPWDAARAVHAEMGPHFWYVEGEGGLLFTNNETNNERLYGTASRTPWVKDAFHRRVVEGDRGAVNLEERGTKACAWRRLDVPAGGSARVTVRLTSEAQAHPFHGASELLRLRRAEADAFYAAVQGTENRLTDEHRAIHRQASAGLIWTMQFYNYDVETWLRGDRIAAPASRLTGRNADWRHLSVADVISMPDAWEYPWFAAWDLAFHTLAMASVDIDQAKAQLKLMVKEWYQHPSGQIPA